MSHIELVQVSSEEHAVAVRELLWEYMAQRNFDPALGDFETELQNLPGEYEPPEGCLLLVLTDGVPAGCVAFRKLDPDTCEMKRMYVSEPHLGNGLGRVLGTGIISKARESGYKTMLLDTHPWMIKAQSLYEKLGFKEIDRYNENPTPGIRFYGLSL